MMSYDIALNRLSGRMLRVLQLAMEPRQAVAREREAPLTEATATPASLFARFTGQTNLRPLRRVRQREIVDT